MRTSENSREEDMPCCAVLRYALLYCVVSARVVLCCAVMFCKPECKGAAYQRGALSTTPKQELNEASSLR